MLQTWTLRLRTLLQGKVILAVCFGFILSIGLSYFIMGRGQENDWVLGNGNGNKKPAAQEQNIEQDKTSIVIDISGAVEKPGLYKLDVSSRVGDAVNAAGGISKNASLEYVSKSLNLAQKLEDTQKIYVPFEWDLYENEKYDIQPLVIKTASNTITAAAGSQPSVNPTSDSPQKADVNKANLEDLDKLSGIGPVYAQKIIDNRPYKDYTELTSKSGIPKSTLEKIKYSISY